MGRIGTFLRNSTEALAERDFRLLWIGQSASALGDALVGVALAFAVLDVGGSAGDLGLVFAAFTVPRVLLMLAGGVWSDRLPRRAVMVACDTVRALAQAVVSTILITGNGQVWHLIVLAAVMGSAAAFFSPATVALMPQVVSRGRLQQANALVSISQSAAHIFGPLVAGALVASAGPGWAFAADGASFVVSGGFLLAMRVPAQPIEERRSFVSELADGWREVASRSWVMAAIVAFALSNAALGAFQVLGPLVAQRELGGAAAWGVIVTGGAIGGLAGGAISLRWKPRRPLIPGFLLMAFATIELLLLIPPFPAPVVALGAMVTIGGVVISNAFWDTMLQQHIPQSVLGRVSSYDWMVSLVLQPIAYAAVGPMSEAIGLTQTLLIAAGIGVVANLGVLLVPSVRRVRRVDGVGPGASPRPDGRSGRCGSHGPGGGVARGRPSLRNGADPGRALGRTRRGARENSAPTGRVGGCRSALQGCRREPHHRSTVSISRNVTGITRRALLERATVREVLMGAQDNLTNVLAVVLGVTIGAGRADLVALAGTAAAVAESISMGGVLYTSTRAELDLDQRVRADTEAGRTDARLGPAAAAVVTGLAALAGGLLPLAPFLVLPIGAAVIASISVSILALFGLGSATASVTRRIWWQDGLRLVAIAGSAALAAALIGAALRVS